MSGCDLGSARLLVITLLVFSLLTLACQGAEGRYLQTRGDESRQEQIKSLIKELLELNENEVPMRRPRFYNPHDLFAYHQMKKSENVPWPEERR